MTAYKWQIIFLSIMISKHRNRQLHQTSDEKRAREEQQTTMLLNKINHVTKLSVFYSGSFAN